jgi:hypothetical protein
MRGGGYDSQQQVLCAHSQQQFYARMRMVNPKPFSSALVIQIIRARECSSMRILWEDPRVRGSRDRDVFCVSLHSTSAPPDVYEYTSGDRQFDYTPGVGQEKSTCGRRFLATGI